MHTCTNSVRRVEQPNKASKLTKASFCCLHLLESHFLAGLPCNCRCKNVRFNHVCSESVFCTKMQPYVHEVMN
jgi:hypothetical protein